jgi:hypothetical protein
MICAKCCGSPKDAKKARLPQSLIAGPCNRRQRAALAPAMTEPNAEKVNGGLVSAEEFDRIVDPKNMAGNPRHDLGMA